MAQKNKKAALELSIGTVVIIVIAISMLILGLVLVRTIFVTTTDNIKSIDAGVKNQIQQLFSQDEKKKLVLIPDQGIIELKQGETGAGFALSIKNTNTGAGTATYSYKVEIEDPQIGKKCGTSNPEAIIGANGWARIDVGSEGTGITLNNGNAMDDPIHIRFSISDSAPICTFRLKVTAKDQSAGNVFYDQKFMDVKILAK